MKEQLLRYVLQLADDSVILGQRLGEWCGHGPVLEIDMALTNVSLDLFGQARSFYQYAAQLEGKGRTEDDMCYLRDAWDYYNCLLVEQPNGDFAKTIVRQYFFDVYQFYLYDQLQSSKDEHLAAIAAKSLKETAYHLRFSKEWMKRLGDGTEESNSRLQNAVNDLWRNTEELFSPSEIDEEMLQAGIGADLQQLKIDWTNEVNATFELAKVQRPEVVVMQKGGRSGIHTEHLGFLLAEMQVMQRTYPGLEW